MSGSRREGGALGGRQRLDGGHSSVAANPGNDLTLQSSCLTSHLEQPAAPSRRVNPYFVIGLFS